MKNIKRSVLAMVLAQAMVWASCTKYDAYKEFIPSKPSVYPGMADSIKVHPGNNRVMLSWILVSDPTISKAKVFWNNHSDSASVNITRTSGVDTVKIIIDRLQETSYTFEVFTYDKEGNKSVPASITGKAYGVKYQQALLNRGTQGITYSEATQMATITWSLPDTINTGTKVWFTDPSGVQKTVTVSKDQNTTDIPWLVGSKIYFQSSYKPLSLAIDTFPVLTKDSIELSILPVPKANWSKVTLNNDAVTDAYGTDLSWIWDGKGGDYPEIYHTDGGGMPHHFTFDLGALYNLVQFENIGRQNDNPYHNPVKFEVWGIASLTGAETGSPADSPGWIPEMKGRGWSLLKEISRTDNGTAPYKVDLLPNLPKVRYIRIRILETIDHDVDSHMSEVSFWYKP